MIEGSFLVTGTDPFQDGIQLIFFSVQEAVGGEVVSTKVKGSKVAI